MKRALTPLQLLVTVVMFVEVSAVAGTAAFPGVSLWLQLQERLAPGPWKVLALCIAGGLAYFLYGMCLFITIPVARWVTGATGVPKGTYPYVSFKGYQWASYNALILIMRYSFLNWIKATPFIVIFYRLMGMKAGARVQINTAIIGDCNLLTVGEDTVIGGDVTLIGHSVEGANLVCAPVKIGSRVTVGLMSVIMPGCEIGDGAMLAANAVLKKGTIIGPNEVWGGVPAKLIGKRGEKKSEDAEASAHAGVDEFRRTA